MQILSRDAPLVGSDLLDRVRRDLLYPASGGGPAPPAHSARHLMDLCPADLDIPRGIFFLFRLGIVSFFHVSFLRERLIYNMDDSVELSMGQTASHDNALEQPAKKWMLYCFFSSFFLSLDWLWARKALFANSAPKKLFPLL